MNGALNRRAVPALAAARWRPPSRADQYPSRPIKIIVPFGSGQLTGFLGMAVPSATPSETVERPKILVSEALAAPEVRGRMDGFGLSYDITRLADWEAKVRAERERWAECTQVAGIQPE